MHYLIIKNRVTDILLDCKRLNENSNVIKYFIEYISPPYKNTPIFTSELVGYYKFYMKQNMV